MLMWQPIEIDHIEKILSPRSEMHSKERCDCRTKLTMRVAAAVSVPIVGDVQAF